jgi:hypothetical protein
LNAVAGPDFYSSWPSAISAATDAACKLKCNRQACDPTRPDPTPWPTMCSAISTFLITKNPTYLQLRSLFHNTTIHKTVYFCFFCSVQSTDLLRLRFSRYDVTAILLTI